MEDDEMQKDVACTGENKNA